MQDSPLKLREQITTALNHLDHVLPGQAPILDFVHHNTLHGFQHLPFEEALAEFEALTGTCGYLPEAQNRKFYSQGRIDDRDLSAAFAHDPKLLAEQIVCTVKDETITRQDLYRIEMLFDLQAVSVSQLNWQIEELDALSTVQPDVPEPVRSRLLAESGSIRQLWTSILNKLGLERAALHPETMLDLSQDQAEDWLAQVYKGNSGNSGAPVHQQTLQQAKTALDELLSELGDSITLRGFIMALSETDILDSVRPQLIRLCASGMDE
ncbi:MAG: putative inorganic carbon transporter subunit DabA, partial [Methylobacter sp.]